VPTSKSYEHAAKLFAAQAVELERVRDELGKMHLAAFEAWQRCEWRLPEWFEVDENEMPLDTVCRLLVEWVERDYNERTAAANHASGLRADGSKEARDLS
jgi:hypothetical protein